MHKHARQALALGASLALAGLPHVAAAHHSYAAFDPARNVVITGTVLTWEWTNPHSHMQVSAPDKTGAQQVWDLEMSSPNILRQSGWTRESLKPGDRVTVLLHPRRDGVLGGTPVTVTTPDGRVLGKAQPDAAGAERR